MRAPEVLLKRLESELSGLNSAVTAFSGGVDSTLVAVIADKVLKPKALAVTAVSPALSERELSEAKLTASEFNLDHRIVRTNEMDQQGYTENSPQRCYFCKNELYSQLNVLASDEGYQWILNGANKDDLGDYRPGLKAASEHQVRSPLVDAGFTKSDVRTLAHYLGISVWDKPAQPCLSSRVPYGIPVNVTTLKMIEKAEDFLKDLGLSQVRARHHDRICRIEVVPEEMEIIIVHREKITEHLKSLGYLWVSLDLAGLRSGSLNAQIGRDPGKGSE